MRAPRLVVVTALLAMAAVPSLAVDATKRDDSASEKLGLKLSMQCWTYNKLTFFEAVDRAARLGVKYVEAFPGQKVRPGSEEKMGPGMSEETIKEIKTKLKEAGGIRIVAFGVADIPVDEKGARKNFEWAKTMGIEVLVTERTPNDVIDKLAAEYGIRVALHNHPKTWPPEKVLEACKDKGKLLGSCSDTGHWMRANLKPVDGLKKLEGRVQHLHFKDLNEFGSGHDVVWGTGKGDVPGILAELKRQGYKGYMSIEFEYGDLEHLDTNLPKCVAFFDKTCAELAK
jgi:sugar phosphate isomerase/epimerase